MRRDPRRHGFTVLEVIVALVVSAIVILGARTLVERLDDGARRILAGAVRTDAKANGDRMLRDLALRLEVGTAEAGHFGGEPETAVFTSWCDVPRGWRERCLVTVTIVPGRDRDTIRVATSTGLRFVALDAPAPAALRYLNDSRAGGQWFQSWGAGITAPLAIGIASPRDTTILRVGERG